MYTFNAFIEEQLSKTDNNSQQAQAFNVMVLYKQYIDWVLKKESTMKVAELLTQLQIINAYHIHYLKTKTDTKLEVMPQEVLTACENKVITPLDIENFNNSIISPARKLFHKTQLNTFLRNLGIGFVAAIAISISLSVFEHMEVWGVLPLMPMVFIGFTVFAVFSAIASDMMGKEHEKAFDKTVNSIDGTRGVMSLVNKKDDIPLQDNGYGQAIKATSAVMLKDWKGAYATQTTAPDSIDLQQVKVELEKAKVQNVAL